MGVSIGMNQTPPGWDPQDKTAPQHDAVDPLMPPGVVSPPRSPTAAPIPTALPVPPPLGVTVRGGGGVAAAACFGRRGVEGGGWGVLPPTGILMRLMRLTR